MRSFGVVVLLAAAASASGCGKQPTSTELPWHTSPEAAYAEARRENKPLFVFAGAEWDAASKELEHEAFPNAEVNQLLRRRFVLLKVDCTDDELPLTKRLTERFKVIGTPTLIVYGPSAIVEVQRFHSYLPPRELAPALRAALEPPRE